MFPNSAMKSIVILISGRGSNMQAILAAQLPVRVAAVISNNPGAPGLEIAAAHGVATRVVDHRGYVGRDAYDAALAAEIDTFAADWVVLAGFMRILSAGFVEHYRGRLINIHPSLLPAYKGLDTHARALADGIKIHGCTVHHVTPELDSGAIIAQAAVPVLADDTPDRLAARVLRQEHLLYPATIAWLATGATTHTDPSAALLVPTGLLVGKS